MTPKVTGREYDLPPHWDGTPVVWDEWRSAGHSPCLRVQPEPCPHCASLRDRAMTTGWIARQGITREQMILSSARHVVGYRALSAFRCLDCKRDQVLDADGTWWILGDEDYEAGGSQDVGAA